MSSVNVEKIIQLLREVSRPVMSPSAGSSVIIRSSNTSARPAQPAETNVQSTVSTSPKSVLISPTVPLSRYVQSTPSQQVDPLSTEAYWNRVWSYFSPVGLCEWMLDKTTAILSPYELALMGWVISPRQVNGKDTTSSTTLECAMCHRQVTWQPWTPANATRADVWEQKFRESLTNTSHQEYCVFRSTAVARSVYYPPHTWHAADLPDFIRRVHSLDVALTARPTIDPNSEVVNFMFDECRKLGCEANTLPQIIAQLRDWLVKHFDHSGQAENLEVRYPENILLALCGWCSIGMKPINSVSSPPTSPKSAGSQHRIQCQYCRRIVYLSLAETTPNTPTQNNMDNGSKKRQREIDSPSSESGRASKLRKVSEVAISEGNTCETGAMESVLQTDNSTTHDDTDKDNSDFPSIPDTDQHATEKTAVTCEYLAIDPIAQHKWFCPWRTTLGGPMSNSSMTVWQALVHDAVSRLKRVDKDGSVAPSTMLGDTFSRVVSKLV